MVEAADVDARRSRAGWEFGSGQALSCDQYRLLEAFIPPAKPGGRPRTMTCGSYWTACSTSCGPAASGGIGRRPVFRHGLRCISSFRAFLQAGVWETMRHHLLTLPREEGREPLGGAHPRYTNRQDDGKGGRAATMRPRGSRMDR